MAKTPAAPRDDLREQLSQLVAAQQALAGQLAELSRQVAAMNERVAALPARSVIFLGRPDELRVVQEQFPEALAWAPVVLSPSQPPYKHLERRPHPWRRQLYVRGRNMTARQLVGAARANKLTPAEVAADFDLPEEAVLEALEYAEKEKDLLEQEAVWERHLLEKRGYSLAPATVPR